MKLYLYAAVLSMAVATPAIAAEQLTDNQMDQVTAGWMPSAHQVVACMVPGMSTAGVGTPASTATAAQPSFEVIVNNQGVFLTHQGSIDLATLAALPSSAFTVTSNANTIVLSTPPRS